VFQREREVEIGSLLAPTPIGSTASWWQGRDIDETHTGGYRRNN
jgi:hypothetical protein